MGTVSGLLSSRAVPTCTGTAEGPSSTAPAATPAPGPTTGTCARVIGTHGCAFRTQAGAPFATGRRARASIRTGPPRPAGAAPASGEGYAVSITATAATPASRYAGATRATGPGAACTAATRTGRRDAVGEDGRQIRNVRARPRRAPAGSGPTTGLRPPASPDPRRRGLGPIGPPTTAATPNAGAPVVSAGKDGRRPTPRRARVAPAAAMALARPPGAAVRAGASTTSPIKGSGRTCPARAPSVGAAACRGVSVLASTLFCRAAGAVGAAPVRSRMAMGLPVFRRAARPRTADPAPSPTPVGPSGTRERRAGAGAGAAGAGVSITSRIGTS